MKVISLINEITPYIFWITLSYFTNWYCFRKKNFNLHLHLFFGITLHLSAQFIVRYWGAIYYEDETYYHNTGTYIANQYNLGIFVPYSQINNPWGYLTGLLYFIFGSFQASILGFNLFLKTVSTVCLFKSFLVITQKLPRKNKLEQKLFYLLTYCPLLIFPATDTIKTQVSLTLTSMMFYFSIIRTKFFLLSFISSFFSLSILRAPQAFINIWALFPNLITTWFSKKNKIPLKGLISISLLILFLISLAPPFQKHFLNHVKERLTHQVNPFLAPPNEPPKVHSFLNKNNVWGFQNIFIVSVRSIYSPGPFNFIKTLDNKSLSAFQLAQTFIPSVGYGLIFYLFFPFFITSIWLKAIPLSVQLSSHLTFWLTFIISALTELTVPPTSFRYRISALPIYIILSFAAIIWRDQIPKKVLAVIGFLWFLSVLTFGYVYLFMV